MTGTCRYTGIPVQVFLHMVVEGNLVVNEGELQYYDYSVAVSSTSLLALTHVPNLVAAPAWFVWRMYGASYSDINTPSPADSGRRAGPGWR